MNKLTVSSLIDFSRRSDRSKATFVNNLKIEKEKKKGGGHYWANSLGAVRSAYKQNNLKIITDRVKEMNEGMQVIIDKRKLSRLERNIKLLNGFEAPNIKLWRPNIQDFLTTHKDDSILTLKELELKLPECYVFNFGKGEFEEVGAISFVAKSDGFSKAELGMYADTLYRHLKTHFSKDYSVNPKYCLAVDIFSNTDVSYSQIQAGEVDKILVKTISDIKRML